MINPNDIRAHARGLEDAACNCTDEQLALRARLILCAKLMIESAAEIERLRGRVDELETYLQPSVNEVPMFLRKQAGGDEPLVATDPPAPSLDSEALKLAVSMLNRGM